MPAPLSSLASAASLPGFLARALPLVDAAIRARVQGIGEPFLEPFVRYQMESGGKRLRPAMALLGGIGLGARLEAVLPFAAACEILHNFFLVHDDIEDGDRVRRDRPALWALYGLPHGVNAGDYLLAIAVETAATVPAPEAVRGRLTREILRVVRRTILGQALDIHHRASADLTPSLWRRIVSLKTGDYLALTLVGPAILAGAPEKKVAALRRAGADLGVAFQARDDALDLTPGKGRGDEIGGDVKEGKPSILVAQALGSLGGPDRARLVSILKRPREWTTAGDVRWAARAFKRCGALALADRTARRLAASGLARLRRLRLKRFDLFEAMVEMIVERKR